MTRSPPPSSPAHPTTRQLLDHLDGTRGPQRALDVGAHLAGGCAPCTSSVQQLESTRALLADGPLSPPPRALVRNARLLFRATAIRRLTERATAVLARLVFDQRTELVPALRSAPGSTRQLLWAADDIEVYVQLSARGATSYLEGEVFTASGGAVAGHVLLRGANDREERVTLDDAGRFRFDALPAETYTVEAQVDGKDILLPPFRIDG